MAKKSLKSEVVEDIVVEAEVKSDLMALLTTEIKPAEVIEAVVVKVVKNECVGSFVRKLISEGLTNTEILKIVHEQYGNKNTTYACVAWYRNKVKKANAVATTTKAVEVVEKFLKDERAEVPPEGFAQQALNENPDLFKDENDEEVLSTEELLHQVGQ